MKISLIITVYNKAPFLERCLNSVMEQTDKSAQVIVIDDGSTDGSAEICDRYNFEIYHTTNRGVSEARNLGIEKAKGEYITFLDADDILLPNAIATMNSATKLGYNIYQFGQQRRKDATRPNSIEYRPPRGHYGLDNIPKYWVMVWNKLYKRQFIEDNHLRFKKGMQFGEDTVFNANCILANNGLYHAAQTTIIHCLDDRQSLCRGNLTMAKIKLLYDELTKLAEAQTDEAKASWVKVAIQEHLDTKLFHRFGYGVWNGGKYDIVYFVKDEPENEELVYSLRSVEKNWPYRSVWFCGGCPTNLRPDQQMKIKQEGTSKWNKVRNMIEKVCLNDDITEDFWLFNDDFFIMKPMSEDMPPQYNGDLISDALQMEKRQGHEDDFTRRLKCANSALLAAGKTNLNYEVHKPMLINRKKALEVLKEFPRTPAFRSIYGNCMNVGGESKHDMKIKMVKFKNIFAIENKWEFLSTSDESFAEGDMGEIIRRRFTEKSRFEIG